MGTLAGQLSEQLPGLSDPDMALNNLDRFFAAARNRLALAAFFERDTDALPTLLQIFCTSQYLSDLLIRDPESFDLLRLTEGQPVGARCGPGELQGRRGRQRRSGRDGDPPPAQAPGDAADRVWGHRLAASGWKR